MYKMILVSLGFTLALGGCASVHPIKVAEAAPVTQKMGEGYMSQASLSRPLHTRRAPVMPRLTERAPNKAPDFTPAPFVPSLPNAPFDMASVDRELYAHQRVGKSYKVFGKRYKPEHDPKYDETGLASWYGPKFHGKPTATGEPFDMNGLSAAHKTLPLNSLVHVENLETGASLILRVNDRGPFVDGRIIDLSKAAAVQLGLLEHGLKRVRVRYAGPSDPNDIGKPIRVPATPTPHIEPDSLIAEAPTPDSDTTGESPLNGYVPLRSLPGLELAPQARAPLHVPTPVPVQRALPQESAPLSLPRITPQIAPQPEQDDPTTGLTLTIKGPIHLATSKRLPNAQFIRPATHEGGQGH